MTKRILLIDDEPSIGPMLTDYLRRKGFTPDWAKTGEEGLTLLAGAPFDLVLLDLTLPDMTGMEVLEHIAARPPAPPVIVISGMASEQSAADALRLGAAAVIEKPFGLDALRDEVRRALKLEALSSEPGTNLACEMAQ